jgi:hypothetical protein
VIVHSINNALQNVDQLHEWLYLKFTKFVINNNLIPKDFQDIDGLGSRSRGSKTGHVLA